MAKYSGIISVGAVGGGGHIVGNNSAIPIAVELISFQIGETFFRKIRVCQQFVSQFIHPGDDASIYVYKQMGITNTIVGVRSNQFPSYSISLGRFLLMLFAQFFFGSLFCVIPALILLGKLSPFLAIIVGLALPGYGAWTLIQAYGEMQADFKFQLKGSER